MLRHIIKLIWNNKKNNFLLFVEMFVSFIILCAVSSFMYFNLQKIAEPLGFETVDRLSILLDDNYSKDSLLVVDMMTQLDIQLKQEPEIQAVSYTNGPFPFSGNQWSTSSENNGISSQTLTCETTEDYHTTMDISIKEGRWFRKPLTNDEKDEVVVNQAFIDKNLGGKYVLDSFINIGEEKKLVGIVETYKFNGEFVANEPTAIYYVPKTDRTVVSVMLKLQEGTPIAYQEKLSKIITDVTKSSNFVINNLDDKRKENSHDTWVILVALLACSVFLFINVAMGLFGVLWYNINKRRSEISLRKAMGATNNDIITQFLTETGGLAVLAVGFGLIFAIQVPLFKIIDVDTQIMYTGIGFSVIFVLGLVIICAFYPAWKGAQIHPATGLKEE
jgi:putative ABC transport system permease protein